MSKRRGERSVPNHVGQRAKELRETRTLTQEQLAERSGLSVASVSRVETGKGADIDTICRIASALGVVPGLLIDPEGANTLSPQEAALLTQFRRLNERQRAALVGFVEALHAKSPRST